MSTKRVRGLLEEQPISVYPSLAKRIGVNKAIILQQVHFLISIAEKFGDAQKHVDRHWWVYNTYADWCDKYFNWLNVGSIKRLFLELEKDGILLSRTSPYDVSDQTKWYTIDYDYWPQWLADDTPSQNVTGTRHKMCRPPSQNVTGPVTKCADVYNKESENTTENTRESSADTPNGDPQVHGSEQSSSASESDPPSPLLPSSHTPETLARADCRRFKAEGLEGSG